MIVDEILVKLREERQLLEEAILSLERLAIGNPRRRRRPPRWMTDIAMKRRGRPIGSKNKPKVAAAGGAAPAARAAQ